MDGHREELVLNNYRRFGVELEINAFDMRDRAEGYDKGKLPEGIYYVGNLLREITGENVDIHRWGWDHNNSRWVVKPDASCGLEVCTPVLKGWSGLKRVCKVIDGLSKDSKIVADERCSLHVHADVSDLSYEEVAAVITWWVKCEAVLMDSVPSRRKRNRYCQLLGQTDIFDRIEDGLLSPETLIRRVGHVKYYSINAYHLYNRKRQTLEFRIMENDACLDAWAAKNWTRLVLHIITQSLRYGLPHDYREGDPWSGYCWLDPDDVFRFLGFYPQQYDLSPGLDQVRSWFLSRLMQNGPNTGLPGVMSDRARSVAMAKLKPLAEALPTVKAVTEEELFGDKYRV